MSRNLLAVVLAILLSLSVSHRAVAALLTTDLAYHLDASNPNGNGTLPANNTGLATWVNLAPGGLPDAVKGPVAAGNPIWFAAAGPNGTPAIQFNPSTTAYYRTASTSGFNFLHDGSDTTVFVVFRTTNANPGNYRPILDTGSALTGSDIGYAFVFEDRNTSATSNDSLYAGIANGTNFNARAFAPNGSSPSGAWQLAATTYNPSLASAQLKILVNGDQVATGNKTAQPHVTTNNDAGGMYIGAAGGNPGFNLPGYISEIAIYNRALSESELRNANQYFKDKYDLSITNVPEPASLALLALGGATLMWRRK